jgi:hypothetical protein
MPVSFNAALWTTWGPLAAGAAVTFLVIGSGFVFGRWRRRRRLLDASREEDLPWEDLLALLERRNRDRTAGGLPPERETEEVLDQLLADLPPVPDPSPVELPEDREFIDVGSDERRAGKRRWGNPTEVRLHSLLWAGPMPGLIVNRSTGGLGIFTDREAPAHSTLKIRAVEAPSSVPAVQVEVRHCRKVGRGYFIGCQFTEDVPWNARVWFG